MRLSADADIDARRPRNSSPESRHQDRIPRRLRADEPESEHSYSMLTSALLRWVTMSTMETDLNSVASRDRRRRREAVAVNAIECSYLRELGRQLGVREGAGIAGDPMRRAQAHSVEVRASMQAQIPERGNAVELEQKAVADPWARAHGDSGRASRSSRRARIPMRVVSAIRS